MTRVTFCSPITRTSASLSAMSPRTIVTASRGVSPTSMRMRHGSSPRSYTTGRPPARIQPTAPVTRVVIDRNLPFGYNAARVRRQAFLPLSHGAQMKPLIVVGGGLHPEGLRLMEQEARVAIVSDSLNEARMIADAKEAAGILFRSKPLCSRSLMSALPNLKVIGRHGVGLDIVDLPPATELGIPVVHAPASYP